ncbi:formyltransferase family protein, partial [Bacillus velezensis]|uniref:formyltransferase family protein n=1 Tax=Bacillus velezensis TaxID=492670 RepID=UPI003C14AA35
GGGEGEVVEELNVPFNYMKANKDIRAEVERRQVELLERYKIDVIVLSRYMQILKSDFVSAHPNRILHTHHFFLPAF